MLTVGNSQKFGIRRGCGYDESPRPRSTSRRKRSIAGTENAALQEGSRVDARSGVPLVIDLVADGAFGVAAAKEVIKARLVKARARRVGREVAANSGKVNVRPVHHGNSIPADDAPDALLHQFVTGKGGLLLARDGVDVIRGQRPPGDDAMTPRSPQNLLEQEASAVAARFGNHRFDRLDPLARFAGIAIRRFRREAALGVFAASRLVVARSCHGPFFAPGA